MSVEKKRKRSYKRALPFSAAAMLYPPAAEQNKKDGAKSEGGRKAQKEKIKNPRSGERREGER